MTAPLEVLRDAIDLCARGRQSYVTLSLDDAVPILTAIEERDAEIERLREAVHPWYGPCDALGGGGECAECNEVARIPWPGIKTRIAELATLTRQLAEMDKEASVQRERANGLEYQCGIYEAKLARYEQAEKQIWERTPSWLGEQLPALAAYLAGVEQQRDAMRGALREARENLAALLAHHERRHDDAVRDGMREGVTRIDRALGAL